MSSGRIWRIFRRGISAISERLFAIIGVCEAEKSIFEILLFVSCLLLSVAHADVVIDADSEIVLAAEAPSATNML